MMNLRSWDVFFDKIIILIFWHAQPIGPENFLTWKNNKVIYSCMVFKNGQIILYKVPIFLIIEHMIMNN